MRILILGATGGIGRALVAGALERGQRVTAFVRSPQKVEARPGLTVQRGDPCNAAELGSALDGHDAVLSALGPPGPGPSTILRDAGRSTVAAMQYAGTPRLLAVSAAVLFEDAGFVVTLLRTTLLRNIAADCNAMERVMTASDLNWTIVRPPRLTNGPLTGRHVVENGSMPRGRPSVSRADVAHFMLDELERGSHVRQIVGLAGGDRSSAPP